MNLKFLLILCVFQYIHMELIAQGNGFKADIQMLYEAVKKTPSYKDQIKGSRKTEYNLLFDRLMAHSIPTNSFDSLYKLSTLLWPIKDNHMGLYEISNKELSLTKRYPIPVRNLDSLEQQLMLQPINSVEGVYYNGNLLKIGVYATVSKDSLIGVILSSTLPVWTIGEMAYLLVKQSNNRYRGVYSSPVNKDLFFVKNDEYSNGRLLFGVKKGAPVNYAPLLNKPEFELKKLRPDIQYLRLSNFRTSNTNIKRAEIFYNHIKDSLISDHLIVDLRNNPGGGFKTSGKFLSLIKKYAGNAKVFIIVNRQTISNAEQFVLKFKGRKNITLLGETTNGTITYGNNFGSTVTLPSGKYKFYITDMKDEGNYLPFEEIGIEPDIKLDNTRDWIEQTIAIIRNEK